MAGSGEIRAKEARAQLSVNGTRLGGSFSTIHDISVKPDAEISKKRFTGQKRAEGDIDIKGWDVSFKTEKRDHTWSALWALIEKAELNGDPMPEITLTLTYSYRDGSRLLRTESLSNLVLKMDENSIPKDGYQTNSWTGFCSYNSAASS